VVADAWGFDETFDGVLDVSWVLEDEGVLLGFLAQGIVVEFCRGEDHCIVLVVQFPVTIWLN